MHKDEIKGGTEEANRDIKEKTGKETDKNRRSGQLDEETKHGLGKPDDKISERLKG